MARQVKNPSAKAGDVGDKGLILGGEDALEKEMATHSSILAWKIPWTEEPGRLQSTRHLTLQPAPTAESTSRELCLDMRIL